MERGSTKHGSRIDDELEHQVRPVVQGAPVSPRAQDDRLEEAPGPGEPDAERMAAADDPVLRPGTASGPRPDDGGPGDGGPGPADAPHPDDGPAGPPPR